MSLPVCKINCCLGSNLNGSPKFQTWGYAYRTITLTLQVYMVRLCTRVDENHDSFNKNQNLNQIFLFKSILKNFGGFVLDFYNILCYL